MKIGTAWPWLKVVSAGIGLRVGIASVPPVMASIQHDFGVGSGAVGLLSAIPVLCMGGGSFAGYWAERRWGIAGGMRLALMILMVGLLMRGVTYRFDVLLLTATLVGLGDALIRPLLAGFISQHFRRRTHAVMGVYAASMGMGASVAAYGTPELASLLSGWQWALGIWALPVAVALLLWCGLSVEGPESRKVLVLPARNDALQKVRLQLPLVLVFGLQAGLNYTLVSWLPAVCLSAGMAAKSAGCIMAVLLGVQMLAGLVFPVVLKWTQMTLVGVALALVPIMMVGIGLLSLPNTVLAGALLLGIGTGLLFPVALSLPIERASTHREAIQLSGVSQAGGYLIGGAMPWLCGAIITHVGVLVGIVALSMVLLMALATTAVWMLRRS